MDRFTALVKWDFHSPDYDVVSVHAAPGAEAAGAAGGRGPGGHGPGVPPLEGAGHHRAAEAQHCGRAVGMGAAVIKKTLFCFQK